MKLTMPYPMTVDQEELWGSASTLRKVAEAAEAAGIDAINNTDHPAPSEKWRNNGGHDAFDPFAMLAFVAGFTKKIRLHTHILVLPYRNPFITAKCATTVDVLSEGRLTIGIGSGYLSSEYSALGADFAHRGDRMDEAIEVMRMAWSGEPVTHQGSNFQAFGALPRPLPVQKRIPIWGGGNGKRAIERAARLCDGYCPFYAPETLAKSARTQIMSGLDDFKRQIADFKESRDRFGRTGPVDILGVSTPLTRMEVCNREAAQNYLEAAGEYDRLGCTWMLLSLPHPSVEALLDNIQWAAEEIVPHLNQSAKAGV